MIPTRVSMIVAACMAGAVAASQAPSEPPRFRVAVDVVSIDAVVTDRKGEVVRDLTAADFEVFQDGKRQKVTFAQFVPVITVAAPAARAIGSSAVPAPAATAAPRVSTPPITREQVRRTIVLVVDDLGLSVEGMNNTRRALRGFVDTGLLPTDLVAIVRTGEREACRSRSRTIAGRCRPPSTRCATTPCHARACRRPATWFRSAPAMEDVAF